VARVRVVVVGGLVDEREAEQVAVVNAVVRLRSRQINVM
jgi:hypothetical protein